MFACFFQSSKFQFSEAIEEYTAVTPKRKKINQKYICLHGAMVLKSRLVLPVLPRLHNPCHGNMRTKVWNYFLFLCCLCLSQYSWDTYSSLYLDHKSLEVVPLASVLTPESFNSVKEHGMNRTTVSLSSIQMQNEHLPIHYIGFHWIF